jgi:hypothetical protein
MYANRIPLYRELEARRKTKLILFVTGDRRGLETQIHQEVIGFFSDHLDAIGDCEKVSLYLYTQGGATLAAWSIANLIHQYCEQFEVIVPSKAHSAGTLICLSAKTIVMTKQATLGPIDPSVNTPLNPPIPGGPPNLRYPVSVEAINGFIELVKSAGVKSSSELGSVMSTITSHVHPLVLGEVFRTRGQIKMLGRRLLSNHMKGKSKIDNILSFLCSESGSHDYTINRQEARDGLGLSVDFPDSEEYSIIKAIYSDIVAELKLTEPLNPALLLGQSNEVDYEFTRALLESVAAGSHRFMSRGHMSRRTIPDPAGITREAIEDRRTFEEWEHATV